MGRGAAGVGAVAGDHEGQRRSGSAVGTQDLAGVGAATRVRVMPAAPGRFVSEFT